MNFLVCLVFCLPDVAAARVRGPEGDSSTLTLPLCDLLAAVCSRPKVSARLCGDPAPRISLVVMEPSVWIGA